MNLVYFHNNVSLAALPYTPRVPRTVDLVVHYTSSAARRIYNIDVAKNVSSEGELLPMQ